MAVTAAEIDQKVANGQITALAGAMAKKRLIGPQALSPAEVSMTTPMASQNDLGSAFNPAAVLAAAKPAAPVANSGPTVGTPGQPMPLTGKPPGYVLSPEEIVGLQNGQYNNAPQKPELPGVDLGKKAALESRRAQLVAELAQVEAQLAQVGAS